MGKPLNIESSFAGMIKISQLYILCGVLFIGMFLFRLAQGVIGFWPSVFILVGSVSLLIVYFGIANSRPTNYFFHWFSFEISPQTYVPGHEYVKPTKENKHGN
jgi:hypothetical protein